MTPPQVRWRPPLPPLTVAALEAARIVRAGMHEKNTSGRRKPPFVVKPGRGIRTAHGYVRAADDRASHDWQYSLDGENCCSIETLHPFDAELRGLALAAVHDFGHRSRPKEGGSYSGGPVTSVVG